MHGIVEEVVGAGLLDAGRVVADDVVVDSGGHARPRVPLHLGRSGKQHRTREDRQDRPLRVDDALLQHRVMQPHSHLEVTIHWHTQCTLKKYMCTALTVRRQNYSATKSTVCVEVTANPSFRDKMDATVFIRILRHPRIVRQPRLVWHVVLFEYRFPISRVLR